MYSEEFLVSKEDLERFPEKTNDEAIIKRIAKMIITQMSKEDLLQLFDLEYIPFNKGDYQRESYRMQNIFTDFNSGNLYEFEKNKEDHERKMAELFEKTKGGRCSYYKLSLKEITTILK